MWSNVVSRDTLTQEKQNAEQKSSLVSRELTLCLDKGSVSWDPAALGNAPWTDQPGSHRCGVPSGHLAAQIATWLPQDNWGGEKHV